MLKEDQFEYKKRKILWLSHAPHLTSGLGIVAHNILKALWDTEKYEVHIIGINYWGDPDIDYEKHPYAAYLYPAGRPGHPKEDNTGRQRLVDMLSDDTWDAVFMLYDPMWLLHYSDIIRLVRERSANRTKFIAYMAVDSPLDQSWVSNLIEYIDYPVLYLDFAKKEVEQFASDGLKERLKVIPHGTDISTYMPAEEQAITKFRDYFFGDYKNDFIITHVGRNQMRKNIPALARAYKIVHDQDPETRLYLHSARQGLGGDLYEQLIQEGLELGKDVSFPGAAFNEVYGFDDGVMNMIYNCSDAIVSATTGEGWGMPYTDAFATKTLVIGPLNTSAYELFNAEDAPSVDEITDEHVEKWRAIPVKSGTNPSLWFNLMNVDKGRKRPLIDVEDLAEKILWAKNNPEKVQRIVENAYTWVQTLRWEVPQKQWVDLFDQVMTDIDEERIMVSKLGRNSECPFCGRKFKQCPCAKSGRKT